MRERGRVQGLHLETSTRAQAWFDSSQWPLLLVTLPQTQTDQDVECYLRELAKFRGRKEPYVIVLDAGASMGFTPRQRQMQGEYVRAGIEESRTYLRAIAFVASSSWRRGMLTAVFWLQPPPGDYLIFSSRDEALPWAMEKLRKP
jgi:hypothetical protein